MKENDKCKPNDRFISTIRGLYFVMNFLGLWPRTNSQKWYNLIWYVQSVGLAFQLFGPAAGLIVQRHDTRKIIDSLSLVIPMACICVKWVTFTMQRKTIETILHSIKEDWSNLETNTLIYRSVWKSERIMITYSRFAMIFFYTYVTMMTLAITNYVRDSIAARNANNNNTGFDKLLPIPNSWYPLDCNKSLNIQLLTVSQTISSMTFSLANASMDTVFVTATLHLCGQFKILRYFIESITYDSSRPGSCNRNVRLMVTRHQVLLGVCEKLQESYNFLVLEQLVACVLTSCFLGYKIIAEIERKDTSTLVLLQTGFVCGATLQTIFWYCLVGDCLTNQSIAIAMAVYNAQWYNSTRSMCLSFSITMIRARKPVEISGVRLFAMSLENFTVLMKAALSYLSALRAMGVSEG